MPGHKKYFHHDGSAWRAVSTRGSGAGSGPITAVAEDDAWAKCVSQGEYGPDGFSVLHWGRHLVDEGLGKADEGALGEQFAAAADRRPGGRHPQHRARPGDHPRHGTAVAAGNADYQPDGVDYPLQLDVFWRNY